MIWPDVLGRWVRGNICSSHRSSPQIKLDLEESHVIIASSPSTHLPVKAMVNPYLLQHANGRLRSLLHKYSYWAVKSGSDYLTIKRKAHYLSGS